ncbi:hypothetical protein AL036_19645 [Salipiger aestuarii]|uniref:Uncharacterized protein n=1 Tax=Salipiger aestuarii TaxID=568098 RepID=A0A327XLT6_9RHOB|nr:hypothetical protein [Salipiger aestuarii]EIE49903.1 hypothetical protein C357_16526 [Citreicella sp. 357]KAA8605319.1 hypothetical protein AL036_19645 [Salipiger aestuarii]KAA8607689.1 hypothetical protein AL037_18455 [Salipiger aestuarii]KAB2538583.1 hypothetical protein AL035_19125 [Salipiger aestuarii]RAK09474.1 hypothetical protein ATI53_106711 [Salipiger aestuarii]
MQPQQIEALFTRDGAYLCARWGRPLSPLVFGVEDSTLATIKGAFEAVCAMTGHKMAETDPELGANVMMFFIRDWDDLLVVPDLDRLIDGLMPRVARLKAAGANRYRAFRFDADGAIKACFVFLRMDAALASQPAEDLALVQAVQVMLTWDEGAFAETSPLGQLDDGRVVLRPDVAALLRAAYDPVMPVAATDPSHALRLSARM